MKDFIRDIKKELKKNTFGGIFYHSLFDGFLITHKDKILCCNKGFCKLFGYKESELKGADISLFFADEDVKKFKDIGQENEYTLDGIKKGGDIFSVKARVKNVVYKGKKLQFLVVNDATPPKDYNRMIRESEDRYRVLTESMLDGIVIVDFSGSILFANYMTLQMFGFKSSNELIGKNIFDFVVPGSIEKAKSALQLTYSDKGGYLVEYQVKDRYGSIFWIEAIGKKTIFEGKETDLICLRDTTERKLAEESIRSFLDKNKKLLEEIVTALSKTIGEKDPYTSEHQRKVAKLSCAIARKMGITKDIREGLKIASVLHDIGKIYIPGEILSAPRKLTEGEMNLVRYHPVKGSEILGSVNFPWPVSKIILQHHERINGTGYPKGLMAEEILIEAKILGVADVVEAMSSHRPYRSALGIPAALEEIKKNKGVLYDEQVVSACLKVFKGGFNF
jgi:PAS domain S-box-containing protein/putative nucleotidyltransferase with HDIG domain